MIKFELDDRQAWGVKHILSRALENPFMFTDVDEDDNEYFDDSLHSEVVELYNDILDERGLYKTENEYWGV